MEQEQFVRIALARIRKYYPFYPQRIAIAAQMYRKWKSQQ